MVDDDDSSLNSSNSSDPSFFLAEPLIPAPLNVSDDPVLSDREERLLRDLCDIPDLAVRIDEITDGFNPQVHVLHRMLREFHYLHKVFTILPRLCCTQHRQSQLFFTFVHIDRVRAHLLRSLQASGLELALIHAVAEQPQRTDCIWHGVDAGHTTNQCSTYQCLSCGLFAPGHPSSLCPGPAI